jgi:hypothetical protein
MRRKEEKAELIYKLGLPVNFGDYPRMEYERLWPRSQGTVDLRL